jgi:hypothetical protein
MDTKKLVEVGGSEWQKGEMHRVYFNDLPTWFGLDIEYYNSGNVCSAKLDGEKISNGEAKRYMSRLHGKLWFDVTTDQFNSMDLDEYVVEVISKRITEAAA